MRDYSGSRGMAHAKGAAMPRAPQTVVDLLHAGAEARGDATWLRYLRSGDVDGPCVDQSYAALLHQASAVAALLQEQGANAGDRALMLFPSGVEFLSALFGCQLAGVTRRSPSVRWQSYGALLRAVDPVSP
jgi:acyl-CoA synthetase (AMP-forming)/AMP-acid ligase II